MNEVTLDTHHHVVSAGHRGDLLTLVLLHGTGGDEHDLLPLADLLAPGAAVLSPRGNVLEGDNPRWFRRHAQGVRDQADLRRRTDELAAWVAIAAQQYRLDASRLVAVGFSNGANIAASTLLRRPGVFRAATLFAPTLPFEPDDDIDLATTAVLVSAGRRDPICPPSQAERLASVLTDRGASVELVWHDGGHELSPSQVERARDWLDTWRAATATDPDRIA